MLIIKQENINERYKDSLLNFNKFKESWKKEDRVYITKLFNFHEFKKKKNNDLGLDFRGLSSFEIPNILDLNNLKYIFVQAKDLQENQKYIFKNIKLIYSFDNYSFDNKNEIEKEIEEIFKRDVGLSDTKYNKILNNTFLEIPVDKLNEEELFKSIVFIRKILIDFLGDIKAKKVKLLLKNNFSQEINQEILKNKLLKINGIII